MHLSVRYTTAYHYDDPPRRIVQLLRVTPASFTGQYLAPHLRRPETKKRKRA